MRELWNGFECERFEFEGKTATVVFPHKQESRRRWLFKTEYPDAFPAFELEMLRQGFTLTHVDNETRWYLESDLIRQIHFMRYVRNAYDLHPQCMCVGLSCGGMQAVRLVAHRSAPIAALYLDAPVINLLSCPCALGDSTDTSMYEEFVAATGMTVSQMLSWRTHPLDKFSSLKRRDMPVFLVAGDADHVVPYHENGKLLVDFYTKNRLPLELVLKQGCDHHPHGLTDLTPLIRFTEKYYY